MGVVYKALDLKLDRLVALKFLRPSPEAVKRLIREAHAISSLNHPHIATIHEIDEDEREPYLVLEYLPGGTLAERISASRHAGHHFSLGDIVAYGVQIARGLAHAHRHGIVHRDVKSGNVMFTADGTLKVVDFGLAKGSHTMRVTQPGFTVGTVAYMAPEQSRNADVDQRADIYSLGVVLYELATLDLPRIPPASIRQVRGDLPPALDAVIDKTLALDPANRYQSMEELANDLRALVSRGDTPTATIAYRPQRPVSRALRLLVVVIAALMLSFTDELPRLFGFNRVPVEKQLLVLPFANIGGDPANQAFCDGLAETLTSSLTQLEQLQGSLRIVPASDVRRQSVSTAAEARRVFGANLVLSGSVQRTQDQVYLTLNLVDARKLWQLDAKTGRFQLSEMGAIEFWAVDRATRMLALSQQGRPQTQTAAPGAYDFYVQAQGYLRRFDFPDNVANAIKLFEKAVEQDPRYAPAHAGLGQAYWRQYLTTRDPRWIDAARTSCRRAVALNPSYATAYVALGDIEAGVGRGQEAISDFQKALELDPANADAFTGLAKAYALAGKVEQAEQTYRKSLELRPGYWAGYNNLAAFYTERGRYGEAERLFLRVVELTPDNVIGYKNLGGLYSLMGRYREAAGMLERSLALKATPWAFSNLGTVYFFEGRYADAVRVMQKAVEQNPLDYPLWGNLGDAYRWAPGQRAHAADAYHRAIALGEKRLSVNPSDAQLLASLAVYHGKLGDGEKALALIGKASRLAPGDVRVLFKSAVVNELTGQRERALDALDAALTGGYSVEEVRREPELADLRRDPRCKLCSR